MLDKLKYAALLPIAKKFLANASQDEILTIAGSLLGKHGGVEVASAVMKHRAGSLEDLVGAVLSTEAVQQKIANGNDKLQHAENTLFVRCPVCYASFESEIIPA